MTTSAPLFPPRPDRWSGVLTDDQWVVGVYSIGEDHFNELHGVLSQVSSTFRESFLGHLRIAASKHPEGAATMIALAHATDEAAVSASTERANRAGATRGRQ